MKDKKKKSDSKDKNKKTDVVLEKVFDKKNTKGPIIDKKNQHQAEPVLKKKKEQPLIGKKREASEPTDKLKAKVESKPNPEDEAQLFEKKKSKKDKKKDKKKKDKKNK